MKRTKLILLLTVLALVAAACGDDDETVATTQVTTAPTTATTTAPTTTAATEPEAAVKTCLVTDLAGVDDRSFNASAWQGVQDAMAAGFATADSTYLESDSAEDWQPNVDQFIQQDCEHIVTVGFALGEVTAINAQAHPEITWTMIDNVLTDANFAPLKLANVRELVYQTDEAAFVAGYIAAGVSESGVLCTYGGANFPTVAIFMDGFTRGAAHYNETKGTDVQVIGWDVEAQDGTFTGSFTDMGLARSTAESMFDENCDIIIPVGGAINLPAGDAIIDRGLEAALVGVDSDAFFRMPPQYQDLWLTTVTKAIAPFITLSIKEHSEDSWTAGAFLGNLANDGVGLSPFHSWDAKVPADLKAEAEALIKAIKDGDIDASNIPVGY